MGRRASSFERVTFTRFDVRDNDSLARLFDRFASRTGIYWLTFDNGEEYVGQSVDARRRLAEHVRRQAGKIVEVRFAPVARVNLDSIERQLIMDLDRDGKSLRNKVITRFPGGRQSLDIEIADGVTISLPWDRTLRGRVPLGYEPALSSPATTVQSTRFAELSAMEVYPRVRQLLALFIDRTLPSPVETEGILWTLSALPSTNQARGWRRLFTLNVGRIESLRIFEEYADDDPEPWFRGFVNMEQPDDPDQLAEVLSGLGHETVVSSPNYSNPTTAVGLEDSSDIVGLLDDEYTADLIYRFHARYMRQGSLLQRRSHNPLFSADVLRAVGQLPASD